MSELSELTRNVNLNPALGPMRAKIYSLLRDRGRTVLLKGAMREGAIGRAYGKLLGLGQAINRGESIVAFARALEVPQTGTLRQLTQKIVESSSSATTDERVKRASQMAVRNLLLQTVGGDEALYYETPLQVLGNSFDAAPLADTAGAVLAKLLDATVRADLLNLSAEAEAAVSTACQEIARSWVDKFAAKYRAGTAGGFKGLFGAIADNYSDFSGGGA
jgi:hypothetical protein